MRSASDLGLVAERPPLSVRTRTGFVTGRPLDARDVAFDAYLIGRMTGERAQPVRWLDAMEMHEVMDTVGVVGRFVLDPFSETAFSYRQEDRRRLMSAGFNAILDVPAAVAATLERVYAGMEGMLAPPHFMHSDEFRFWLVRDFRNGLKETIRHSIRSWTESRTLAIGPRDVPYGYFTLEHAGVLCGFAPSSGAGLRPLPAVSRSLGVPVAGLVRAALEGRLRAVKSGDGIGLSGVLVDVEESASLASLRMRAACDGFASSSRLMAQKYS
ncbi:hypothetical protein [Pseudaminobacter sp. NGMCC 1.201702]|uniref:hypothetical protein n=1 Tax=Pseudaminobacter sp. NGMCC 1.201702 TaxID=3391825 RepID=UPI0039EF37BD